MAKKALSRNRRTEEDFLRECPEYFSTTHPLHHVFKTLYLSDADKEFVEFLFFLVRLGDNLSGVSRPRPKRAITKITKKRLPWPDFFREHCGDKYLEEYDRSREEGIRQTETALHMFAHYVENQQRKRSSLENIGTRSPTLKKILAKQDDKVRRTKADPTGTFFLFCLSEHLREKAGKPKFNLCGQTLRRVREKQLRSSATEGRSAKVRVNKFKQHMPDWKRILEALKSDYQKHRADQKQPVPKLQGK